MKSISHSIQLARGLSLMCVLFGAGFAGCNGAADADEAVLGRAFKIKYGQELTLKGEGLMLKFASVADGRCPTDALRKCITEGSATILIDVKGADAEGARVELDTNRYPQEKRYRQYSINFLSLSPHPRGDVGIEQSDYVATLVIKKG